MLLYLCTGVCTGVHVAAAPVRVAHVGENVEVETRVQRSDVTEKINCHYVMAPAYFAPSTCE